ncbi:ABC transporter ATP-binding protein [Nocardioides sp. CPCC 205120]|uniref:ABC transporter ATP-binding protein n=1 Tax=Nocardioides sp. CPCC 205120 TaxID=3406462 RepID=UPI003B508579
MIRHAFTLRDRWLLVAGILVGLVGAAATLVQPLLVGGVVERWSAGEPVRAAVAVLVLLFVADLLLGALSFWLIGSVGEQLVATMRSLFVGKLLRADLSGFQRYGQGDLMTRGVSDTAVARLALSSSLAQVVTSGFTVLGCLAVMVWIDWRLLLVTLAVLALASAACLGLARRIRRQSVQNRKDTSAFGEELLRVVTNVSTVKACGNEGAEQDALGATAEQARRSGVRVILTSAFFTPVMNVGTQLALVVVVAWGMSRAVSGQLSLADLSAFVMYVLYVVAPLVTLFMGIADIQQARAAIDRLDEVMGLEEEEGGTALTDDSATTSVSFEDVSFAYPGSDHRVLHGLDFELPRVGMTAVVGVSGAGKSTIFNLVERFHDPDEGRVRLFGVDTRALHLAELRTQVGLVEQDCPLMRGTVRSNVRYGAPDASEEEMWRALRQAQLADVVAAMPAGLDTELGEQGLGLSGGQRQRLAIARTLLRDPRVLLLDEATANLDSTSEAALNQAMRVAAAERHVLVIAHRMSTVRAADEILLVADGRLVARGTHEELYCSNEAYRTLASSQLEDGPAAERDPAALLPA